MINVLTQPYRRPRRPERDNFRKTMTQPFDLLTAVQQYAASTPVEGLDEFVSAHPSGQAHLWAMANNQVGRRVWPLLQIDDLVLFHGHSVVYAAGFVSARLHWPGNNFIWPEGENWDYLYALRDVTMIDSLPDSRHLGALLGGFSYRPAEYHDLAAASVPLEPVLEFIGLPHAAATPSAAAAREADADNVLGTQTPPAPFTGLRGNRIPVNPNYEAMERGNFGHSNTVDAVRAALSAVGLTPRHGTRANNFDIGWMADDRLYVAEVKSLTPANTPIQIRLGLGQVLDFAQKVRSAHTDLDLQAVLIVESEPNNADHWAAVCNSAGVLLTWPAKIAAQGLP